MPGVIGGGQGREGGANGADVEYNVEYKVEAIMEPFRDPTWVPIGWQPSTLLNR